MRIEAKSPLLVFGGPYSNLRALAALRDRVALRLEVVPKAESINMKWLFLLGSSAVGSAVVVALSGIIAGKGALGGLELFSRQPESLFWFGLLVLEWALLTNDIAASKGLSRILGQSVEFRETRIYAGESDQLIPLRTKFYVMYPYFIVFFFAILAIQIARL